VTSSTATADMLSRSVRWLLGACGAYGPPQSLQ